MFETKIMIEAQDLAAAISKLADALAQRDPQPAVEAPAAAPAVNPTPAPAEAPTPAPAAPQTPMVSPVFVAPIPTVPVSAPPAYTLDQIARAGAALVDAGKTEQLLAVLSKYGVAAVTQLTADQFGAVATDLRTLGAQI